jgi:hypothetical protein
MSTLRFRITGLALAAAVAWPAAAAAQAPAGQPPCAKDFIPLRTAVEKEGALVKAAIDHKAPRNVVCNRLKKFVAVEGKFVKYVVTNQTWCGIPQQAITQVKASHEHSTKLRNQACSGGGGPPIPAGPGLSEALGTSRAPTANSTRTGVGGTFNTLTGNPLR